MEHLKQLPIQKGSTSGSIKMVTDEIRGSRFGQFVLTQKFSKLALLLSKIWVATKSFFLLFVFTAGVQRLESSVGNPESSTEIFCTIKAKKEIK